MYNLYFKAKFFFYNIIFVNVFILYTPTYLISLTKICMFNPNNFSDNETNLITSINHDMLFILKFLPINWVLRAYYEMYDKNPIL